MVIDCFAVISLCIRLDEKNLAFKGVSVLIWTAQVEHTQLL